MAVTQGLLDGTAAEWVTVGVALLTSLGVYTVPNDNTRNRRQAFTAGMSFGTKMRSKV